MVSCGSGESALGIDVGGTFIKAALVDPHGRIGHERRVPTRARSGKEAVIEQIGTIIDEFLRADADHPTPVGIGVAVTGQVDYPTGTIIGGLADRIPGWIGTPLKTVLQARCGLLPVVIENDAKAAAVGEFRFGAGKSFKDIICLTIGTGVGGGIILDGRLVRKRHGAAGELGHMTVDLDGPQCECGNRGCLEALVSGPRLISEVLKGVSRGEPSIVPQLAQDRNQQVNGELLVRAAQMGDPLVLRCLGDMAKYLGVAMANLVNALGPEVIVIGGGMAEFGRYLINPAVEVMTRRSFGVCAHGTKVVQAALGSYAGVVGSAALAFDLVHGLTRA